MARGVRSTSAAAGKRKTARRKRRPPAIRRPGGETALALFAHDVRTALTGMLALGELLATADLGPREREWAEAVRGSAEHLTGLTTLVVDAAKAKSAGLPLRSDPFRPPLFAEAIAASLSARAAAKGLTAAVSIADDLPDFLRGDVVRLRAALENLIDNAVKFTDRGTVGLTVTAEPAQRRRARLVFVVSDTGLGLDRAALRRLFRPYAQASADVARRYGGAGVGLAAVKRIAKAMSGDLAVASRPGEGSRFRLDVVLAQAAATGRIRGAKTTGHARRLTILCVADNPFGRVILDAILTELGHTASFASSGEAAAEMLTRGDFAAVLMDVAPLELGAVQVVRRIRALPGKAGRIPIIGLTARAMTDEAAAARAAEVDRFVRKPVSPQALAEALRTVLARG
jgi:CheY-like chemotaxis protein